MVLPKFLPTAGDTFDHNIHQAMGENRKPPIWRREKIALLFMSAGYMFTRTACLKPRYGQCGKKPPESKGQKPLKTAILNIQNNVCLTHARTQMGDIYKRVLKKSQ